MNTWQALKKIVRDQFTRQMPDAPRGYAHHYHIVHTGSLWIMPEEFPTREAAQAKIDHWESQGEFCKYLKVCSRIVKL